eukprot:1713052-Rhodomonas_salina.1
MRAARSAVWNCLDCTGRTLERLYWHFLTFCQYTINNELLAFFVLPEFSDSHSGWQSRAYTAPEYPGTSCTRDTCTKGVMFVYQLWGGCTTSGTNHVGTTSCDVFYRFSSIHRTQYCWASVFRSGTNICTCGTENWYLKPSVVQALDARLDFEARRNQFRRLPRARKSTFPGRCSWSLARKEQGVLLGLGWPPLL